MCDWSEFWFSFRNSKLYSQNGLLRKHDVYSFLVKAVEAVVHEAAVGVDRGKVEVRSRVPSGAAVAADVFQLDGVFE